MGSGQSSNSSGPSQQAFDALRDRVVRMEQQIADLVTAAQGHITPGAPPPPAVPLVTPSGNFLTSANGVIAGPSTADGNMDGAGPASAACPPISGQPGSAVMDGSNLCTLFAQNAHSRLNIIFKFPDVWSVAKIWLLRGVHSPNYAPRQMTVYAYSGDDELTLNSNGEFDDSGISWTTIGTYSQSSSPPLANANTCQGSSYNSRAPTEGDTRWVDNLDFSALKRQHELRHACMHGMRMAWHYTSLYHACVHACSRKVHQAPLRRELRQRPDRSCGGEDVLSSGRCRVQPLRRGVCAHKRAKPEIRIGK